MSISSLSQNSQLIEQQKEFSERSILDLFSDDAGRVETFSCDGAGLHLDYSKNAIDKKTLSLLINAAEEKNLSQKILQLLRGDSINYTEKRPALHSALRLASLSPKDNIDAVQGIHQQMKGFVEQVHSGHWLGHSGKAITDVVNIGIGGSDLGPSMINEALRGYRVETIRCHFVSNVDAADIVSVLDTLDPATTLFVVASKTF